MDATQRVRAMLSFVQAADRGSFAGAARALGISAAAVGKNVAGLEAALGVRLMNRSTRSLQLTAEGQVFLDGARQAIDALDAAIDGVAAQRAEPAGRVRLSTSHIFGHRYLLPLVPGLCERYPLLNLELEFDDRRVDLVRDGFDLALRGGQMEDSSLVSRQVCELHTVLAASPDYLARHGVPRRWEDLAQHRLIALRYLNGQVSRWRFQRGQAEAEDWLPAPAVLTVSDPQAAVGAAAQGLGIAQIGLHQAWPLLQQGQLKVLLARQHVSGARAMALQYPHRALMAPRVRVTVDYLLAGLAQVEALHLRLDQLTPYQA